MRILYRSTLLLFVLCAGGCERGPGPAVLGKGAVHGSRPSSLALAPLDGKSKLDGEIARVQAALKAGPEDAETWARLARMFVRKARQDSQAALYAQAGDAADRALALQKDHHGALEVRQAVLLNDHRFVEARRLAAQLIAKESRDPVAWGTLGDSALELGDYQAAGDAYQHMVDLKPELRSYSRGAWMRWLIGDAEGAVELMVLAAKSGSGEPRHFCLVQVGDLHFMRGSYPEARAAYEEVLREAPEYAPALAARGRLHLASDRVAEALVDLDAALRVQPLTSTRAAYVEALWAAGQSDAAKAELERLVREGRREDPRTLALFYSTHDLERAEALALATAEAKIRPDIFSLDALAWALYRNGKLDEAWVAIQQATRLGTRDPRLLYHRGRIAASRNMKQEAIEKLTLALKSSRWNRKESEDARTTLAQLQGR